MNWDRVYAARAFARSLFWVAGFMIVIPLFLFIAAPMGTSPMFRREPEVAGLPISWLPTALGFGGMLFGLAWMWRIYRAPTKYCGSISGKMSAASLGVMSSRSMPR